MARVSSHTDCEGLVIQIAKREGAPLLPVSTNLYL